MHDFDAHVEEIEKANEPYLKGFKKYLKEKGLAKKTIDKHTENIEFFASAYLSRYRVKGIKDGIPEIDGFLGDWFIRKTTWVSKTHILENITSFKKFYQFLLEKHETSEEDIEMLEIVIDDGKEFWLERLQDYDNGTFFELYE